MLNANSFNHIFAPITPPPPQQMSNDVLNTSSTTIIDLSTVGENDDDLEIVNVTTGSAVHRKRQHSGENINEHKRNRQLIYSDNQKNVPLKKRGVGNQRDDELNFLNIIASENQDSNQAQNLKIASKKDSSTACDSTSSSNGNVPLPKHIYHNLEIVKGKNDGGNKLICNCFECFPALGSSSGSRPKCVKANRQQRLNSEGTSSTSSASSSSSKSTTSSLSSAVAAAAATISAIPAKIDVTLLPGPSGLQKKTLSTMPVKKRSNYYESDDDYDSDEQNPMLPLIPNVAQADVKNGALTAPHLQLDWLSDENTSQGEEDDDDVIFVSDRSEPIDLTADSDSENDNARVSLPPSSVDEENIENNRLTGETINASISSVWPLPMNIEAPRSTLLNPRVTTSTSNSTSQRTPIMASVELPPRQNSPHVVITMNPRPRPIPTRPINFHDMITGNDVMLYDGSSQTTRPSVVSENTRATTIVLSSQNTTQNGTQDPTANPAHYHTYPHNHHHHQTINNGSSSNNNAAHNHQSLNYHHHRRHFYQSAPSPSQNAEPNTENSSINEDNNNTGGSNSSNQQQQQNQNCRQHVGRCPFMTEGHHYNRPRRLPRDYYAINNGRPYAVHEDLWRRQYQEQEIRRQYWSSTFNEPEVQVLRPPPATSHNTFPNDSPYVHRLVPLANDANPTAVPPNDILTRNFDRLARIQRCRRSQ